MRRLQDTAAAILIIVVAAAVFAPWLLGNQVLYWGDIGLYFHPMNRFLDACLLHGVIPLWNPEILCGTPYVGNPQTWPFYPSTLLLPWLGAARYLIIDDVMHIAIAGLCAYWFLRGKRGPLCPAPALLGAIVYMLGGALVSKAQFPNMLQAMAWVPAVVLLAQRIVIRPGARSAALFGLALGLQVLAAHAQIVLMTLYLSAAYAVFTHIEIAAESQTPPVSLPPLCACLRTARLALGWGMAGGAIGLGLSAVAWLPVIELWRHAERQVLTIGTANRFYLPYSELTNFVLPFLHGSPYFGNWTARGNFWETACYLGIVPVLLIVIAKISALRHPASSTETFFWLAVFAACVWLALGKYGGLYYLAYYLVPGVKAFHDPGRFLLGTALSGATLAAYGAKWLLDCMRTKPARITCALALLLFTVCDLGWFDRHQYPTLPVSKVEPTSSTPVLAGHQWPSQSKTASISSASRVLMLDTYGPWKYYVDYKSFHANDARFMSGLRETGAPNVPMADLVPEANGYEPVAPKNAESRWERLSNMPLPSSELLDEMSVGMVITYRDKPITSAPGLSPAPNLTLHNDQPSGKRPAFYINDTGLPRARFRLARGGQWRSANASADEPDRFQCSITGPSEPVTFVLADTDYPGWFAKVEGQPIAIHSTVNGFRQLNVVRSADAFPKPSNVVTMEYRPGTFVLGLYASLMSLAGIMGVLIGTRRHSALEMPS